VLRQLTLRAKITHPTAILVTMDVAGDSPQYFDCYNAAGALLGESQFNIPGIMAAPLGTVLMVPQYFGGSSGTGVLL
jgi:hypothetical protein